MISPETLRRYPFFGQLTDKQLQLLAMSSEELRLADDQVLLNEGEEASTLYFLMQGCIDLFYTIEDSFHPENQRVIPVTNVNPGEPFGISALIAPHVFTSTARSCGETRLIALPVEALREAFAEDPDLELELLKKVATAALQRLHATRIQLAAAWA